MGEAMRDQYSVTCSAGPGDSHGASLSAATFQEKASLEKLGWRETAMTSSHSQLPTGAPSEGLRYLRAKSQKCLRIFKAVFFLPLKT